MCTQRRLGSGWASAQSDQFSLSIIQLFIFQSHRNLSFECTAKTDQTVDQAWEASHFVGFVMRWLSYGKNRLNQQADYLRTYWRSGSVTRASDLRPGSCGLDPRPSHTRDFENGISCSFVCARH